LRYSRARIGLAVPGRPIRSLVAEDRSAAGVRDRTEPEPHAHELANGIVHEPARQGSTGRDKETEKLLLRHTTGDLRLRGERGSERLRA
jgi:hypothetical protein